MSTPDGTSARWWAGDRDEVFWLEITDRDDLGSDLHAPAEREEGGEYWSYSMVREVAEGDVVLHYRARPNNAITHWSRAVGDPYPDRVYWGAHGQASGRGPASPYWRPGWRHPLDGPYELAEPVTARQLQGYEPQIRAVYESLRASHPRRPIYFPFQLSDHRPLRAFQGYLTKFPSALTEVVPQLAAVREVAAATRPTPRAPAPAADQPGLGTEYRSAEPAAKTAQREPFSIDPDLIDRALTAHAETQDALAQAVRDAGLTPRSARPGEPVFDIAWEVGDTIVVAEVKSLTPRNEERQLRLALGQVLRYAHLLAAKGRPVQCVIAVEREPTDTTWIELCDTAGVVLAWPASFAGLFSTAGAWPAPLGLMGCP